MGFVISDLVFALPSILLFIVIGYAYHIFTIMLALLTAAVMLMLYFAISFLAFGASFLPNHTRGIWSYTGILTLALTLFPPIYYPYTELPKPLLYFFLILPSGSAAVLLQGAFGFSPMMYASAYAFAAESIICVAGAMLALKWKMNYA